MRDAVIVDAVRSPMGRGAAGGALSGLHPMELLAQTIAGLLARVDIDPTKIGEVIVGCAGYNAEQPVNAGRMAWLSAGLPEHLRTTTLDFRCRSDQPALQYGAEEVAAGAHDLVVVAGLQSTSRAQPGSGRTATDRCGSRITTADTAKNIPPGISAELIAARWSLERGQLDEYAARSHERANDCARAGDFRPEIVPIVSPNDNGRRTVVADETIQPGTTIQELRSLTPAFRSPENEIRFPEISWSATAGNSSQVSDGAAAMLVASADAAKMLSLQPRARFHAFAVCANDPVAMLTGTIPATKAVLSRSELTIRQLDHYEVDEEFAAVPLAWQKEFDANPDMLNPRGGAIALGRPVGASGTRMIATMINALEATGGRYGLQTMTDAAGMASATIVERL